MTGAFTMIPVAARRLLGTALLLAITSVASAIPVMDMRAEDLVPMVSEFRNELKLTPNQLTLWQRVEGRSKTIVRERKARREQLQQVVKDRLATPKVELRDVNALIEAETKASAQEDKQLRDLWLEVNDALDDNQRQQVATMMGEQLMRVADPARAPQRGGDDNSQKRGSGGRRGGGSGMGMGGSHGG
jgi:hypothetical protein